MDLARERLKMKMKGMAPTHVEKDDKNRPT
jgi:hypothetical protein